MWSILGKHLYLNDACMQEWALERLGYNEIGLCRQTIARITGLFIVVTKFNEKEDLHVDLL